MLCEGCAVANKDSLLKIDHPEFVEKLIEKIVFEIELELHVRLIRVNLFLLGGVFTGDEEDEEHEGSEDVRM